MRVVCVVVWLAVIVALILCGAQFIGSVHRAGYGRAALLACAIGFDAFAIVLMARVLPLLP